MEIYKNKICLIENNFLVSHLKTFLDNENIIYSFLVTCYYRHRWTFLFFKWNVSSCENTRFSDPERVTWNYTKE